MRDVSAAVSNKVIVTGVNFDIPAGTKMALVGTNGAGKSTLLRALAGINPAVAGEVVIGDQSVAELKPKDRAKLISFVSQEETPPADLRLGEMVALGRIPHRPPWAVNDSEHEVVVDALRTVGLERRINSSCDHLSGGERRRAMLARGLAQQCPILMLDEPTNHLDIAWTMQLLKLLRGLPVTVITAMHDLDLVMRTFDLVAVLHDHQMIAFGKPKQVLNEDLMAEAFKVDANQVTNPVTDELHLLISRGRETDEQN